MEVSTYDERTLTELDHVRIARLIRGAGEAASSQIDRPIDDILDTADLVSSNKVDADIVTMYSQVELADVSTGKPYRLTLCYPTDAQPASGFVSVLSPVGASLIGRRVGSIARWQSPSGDQGAAKVLAVLFQPEANGDYTM